MKAVPANKQKSLGKLPTEVRNKMGFMKKGGNVKKKAVKKAFKSHMMYDVKAPTMAKHLELKKKGYGHTKPKKKTVKKRK